MHDLRMPFNLHTFHPQRLLHNVRLAIASAFHLQFQSAFALFALFVQLSLELICSH